MENNVQINYFDNAFVQCVRDSLLEQFKNDTTLSDNYDQEDINKINNGDDWFIRRFLVEKPSTTVSVAVKKIRDAMIWRKKFGVNQLHDAMFPSEFYKVGCIFPYLPDKEGNNVFIFRLRLMKKNPASERVTQGREIMQQFIIYRLEQLITTNPNRKIRMVIDFQKASIFNADLQMSKFLMTTLMNFYYDIFTSTCFFEMPWLLNTFWLLIRSWLSEEEQQRVQFCSSENITAYIALEHLPDFMGGTASENHRQIPDGTLGTEKWALQVGLATTAEKALKMKQFLDDLSAI